jgi:hypothetical protein
MITFAHRRLRNARGNLDIIGGVRRAGIESFNGAKNESASAGERHAQGEELDTAASSSPSTAWSVTFWSMTSVAGSLPDTAFQWSQNAMTSRRLGGLGAVGVGIGQAVGAAVLAEEGQH